jgi:hypothetical protein
VPSPEPLTQLHHTSDMAAVDGRSAPWHEDEEARSETPGGSRRVTFSREAASTRELPMDPGSDGTTGSVSLPDVRRPADEGAKRAKRLKRRSRIGATNKARPAPKQPKSSQVGKVSGACSGTGLPGVSAPVRRKADSARIDFAPLGLDYSGLSATADLSMSMSESLQDWNESPQQVGTAKLCAV